jgi:AraC-like DNA-binding protein
MASALGLSVLMTRSIARALTKHGLSEEQFLKAVGAPPDNIEARVAIDRVGEVLEEIAERRKIPHLALDLTLRLPLGTLGITDYYFSSSATLLDACVRAALHMGILTDALRLALDIEGDRARIAQQHLLETPRIIVELTSAMIARRMADLMGEPVHFTATAFTHQPHGATDPYQAFFGGPVEFGAASNDLVFPRDLLAQRMLTSNPELAKLVREHPKVAAVRAQSTAALHRVRADIAHLMRAGGEGPTVEAVAERQNMSVRSLQRKLQERGASFSDLVDEVRREVATELLAREGIALVDVAQQLGFRDMTGFFRAFKRWTGTTPRAFQTRRRPPRA